MMEKADISDNIWESIREGDEAAFRLLYEQHADVLYGYGMKIVADNYVVTNAIQSLFMYIFEKRRSISTPISIRSYLCVSLRRLILKDLKKSNRYSTTSYDNDTGYGFGFEIDIESSIINSEYDKEQLDALQEAINGLSNQQREVMYLKYYKGLSNEEIANILGVSNQIVRNIASRSIARLRETETLANAFLLFLVFYLSRSSL